MNSRTEPYSTTLQGSRPNLPALTGLRFFAAVLVVFHHCSPLSRGYIYGIWPPGEGISKIIIQFISMGYSAVGIFFVLSGLVLTYSYGIGSYGIRGGDVDFWFARFSRLYPVYLFGMALYSPFILWNVTRFHPGFISRLSHIIGYGTSTALLIQSWIPPIEDKWNGPGWSLSAEAFYYAVFPIAYIWLAQKKPSNLAITAVVMYALTVIPSIWIARNINSTDVHFDTNFPESLHRALLFSPLRLPEFLIGVILGISISKNQLRHILDLSWVPVVSLIMLIVAMSTRNALLLQFVIMPLCCLLLGSLMCSGGIVGKVLSSPLLVLLGEASYSLYIIHIPLYRIYLTIEDWSLESSHFVHPFDFWLYLMFVIGSSVLVCRYIERPACRFLRERWAARKSVAKTKTTQADQQLSADPESADIPEMEESRFNITVSRSRL